MKRLTSYLSDESFNDDFSYSPEIIYHREPRADVLVKMTAGRRVLHVGFADHAPLIASRVASGSWLHGRVSDSAAACEGIDISPEAVDIARQLGYRNVHLLDVFAPEASVSLADWGPDLVIVPDVIEHLPDPAAFLRRLGQCLPQAEFVITVPNALSLRNAVRAASGVERINTDHRAWFSPFTLLKVTVAAGLRPLALHGAPAHAFGSVKAPFLHALMRWRPIWSDVLLVMARVSP